MKLRRMLRKLFVVLVVGRASLASAAPIELEPLRVELIAPPACPTEPSLLARVQTHTSHVREATVGEASRVLHVDIARLGEGYVADLRLVEDREETTRRVPGKSCEEVLAAVALITALSIDAHSAEPRATAIAKAPAPEVTAPKPDPPPPPPPAPRALPTRARAFAVVGIGASLAAQSLDGLVIGTTFWAEGALRRRFTPSLRLRISRSESFTEGDGDREAFFRLTAAALEGCIGLGDSRSFELRPCVELELGALEGASAAFGATHEARPWVAPGALLRGRRVVLGPLAVEASLGITAPIVRDDFLFRPHIAIYRAPPLVVSGQVGVGVTFP